MPDITGFTEFISTVEIAHGQHIITELLETLLSNRTLGMELAEIEGDALLLFRPGAPPPLAQLMAHISRWFESFHLYLKRMQTQVFCGCGACQKIPCLSLKVIGHYGHVAQHTVGGRPQIFGTDVILPHRMLKNGVGLPDYVLFSQRLWSELRSQAEGNWVFNPHQEDYPVFGQVEMAVLDMGPYVAALPPPPPLPATPPMAANFEETLSVNAPFEEVASHVGSYSKWPLWNRGMQPMPDDFIALPRKGSVHQCVVDGKQINLSLEAMHRDARSMIFANRVSPPPPLVKEVIATYTAEQTDEGVRVTARVEYQPRPLMGWLVRKLIAGPIQRRFRGNLGRLKALLESGDLPRAREKGATGEPRRAGGISPRNTAGGPNADVLRHGMTGA
jgi:hypothetical protein